MRHQRPKRRGGVSLVVLIAMPAVLLAVGLALYSSQLAEARVKLTNAADAAALAAVQTLVDDDVLLEDREVMLSIFDDARDQAAKYHDANPVKGGRAVLGLNRANRPDGDVVIGAMARPRVAEFFPADVGGEGAGALHTANAVSVRLERTRGRDQPIRLGGLPGIGGVSQDMVRSATAILDRRVYGFAPAAGQEIRLGGMVEAGSLRTRADGVTIDFVVGDGEARVPVTFAGIVPDLFVEGSGVVAEGAMRRDGTFEARNLLAKHDENYMPPEVADALKRAGRWKHADEPPAK